MWVTMRNSFLCTVDPKLKCSGVKNNLLLKKLKIELYVYNMYMCVYVYIMCIYVCICMYIHTENRISESCNKSFSNWQANYYKCILMFNIIKTDNSNKSTNVHIHNRQEAETIQISTHGWMYTQIMLLLPLVIPVNLKTC